MQVGDILRKKTHARVVTVRMNETVAVAAQLMRASNVSALVVKDVVRTEGNTAVGMFTERDVLQRVVAEQRDPARTLVAEVMTTEVACCTLDTPLDEARGAMKNRRVRHLPLVDGDNRLEGLISIGDLNAYEASDQEHTIYLLQEYLYGRV